MIPPWITGNPEVNWRDQAISLIEVWRGCPTGVDEFYKKGCQEKTPPSTGGREDFCLAIQPTVCSSVPWFAQGFCSGWFSLRLVFPAGGDNAYRVRGLSKRKLCLSGDHGSIRGSWPIAISDHPRGHSVKMVTRCQGTRTSSSTDTRPRSERLQNRPATTSGNTKDGKSRSPEMLKLLADLIVWRRSPPLSST